MKTRLAHWLLAVLAAFWLGWWSAMMGLGTVSQYDIDKAIKSLEVARGSHQFYVDNPNIKAPWQVYSEQEADWVEQYDFIIDVIRRLAK